ncbi:HBL222Cp [Eremothecium sinecaudum]|uniref:Cargo-transport protein YPP1 n=1 Tax=Eremothecium sinecaudum TaxID=45286 RepID=A0A109UW87_9SACH|nr:HBL222Cp [Eremothecium sinecaudum]AMD18680.1 HBL222Cp [Eremothecium sinecaudum]
MIRLKTSRGTMDSTNVVDPIAAALEARLVGLNAVGSGDSILDSILALHYRVMFHTFDENSDLSMWKVLLEDSQKLEPDVSEELHSAILKNVSGIANYYLGNGMEADRLLYALGTIDGVREQYFNFWCLLQLENLCYRIKMGSIVDLQVLQYCRTIPKESYTLVWYYLEKLITSTTFTWKEIQSEFGSSPMSYLFGILVDQKFPEAELISYCKKLLAGSRFPSAHESNNFELEEFFAVLQFYFRRATGPLSRDWGAIIERAVAVTFQSISISKAAIFYYFSVGEDRVGLLNFINFINYSERRRRLTGTYDVISLIDAYGQVMKRDTIPEEIGQTFSRVKSLAKYKQIVSEFYQYYNLKLISNEDSIDWFSNSFQLWVPSNLARALADAWYLFYQYEKSSLTHLLQKDLSYYLANAMCLDSNNLDIKFQYAYVLASMRRIEKCVKFLKTAVLNVAPEDYKSWHLLALCESIQENKAASLKIVWSVLEAMTEAAEEGRLKVVDKWQLIHLKLTQLSLVKETVGIKDALEMLPEVYQLYSMLFPTTDENSNDECRIGPQHKQTKEYLFQSIWFFAAKLFIQDNDLANAQEAIDEAKRVTTSFTNLNVNTTKGYISLSTDNLTAMNEFQNVLCFDPANIDAIVGFAKVLYPDANDKVENFTRHKSVTVHDSNHGPSPISAFANEKDRSAAVAQLKLMLESCIERSIEGYHTPEIWWYASKVYDEYKDSDRLEEALWQCIKFEELKPIRGFKNCAF